MGGFLLVEDLDEVKKNIIQFNNDVKENKEMRRRFLSHFRQWYYIRELDMFAPSKYIGYKNMNAYRYNNKDGTGADGRKTEAVLNQWFIKKDIPRLLVKLQERMIGYGKVNKRSEIHILKTEEQYFNGFWDVEYSDKTEIDVTVKALRELKAFVDTEAEVIEITETEKEQVIKSRIGQSAFKKALLTRENKCCLCGVSDERFLVASHIKPWSKSNHQERLDVNNGLLLCPNHDALFDKGYISFEGDGTILISDCLDEATKVFLNINETMKISMSENQRQYMNWHRGTKFSY